MGERVMLLRKKRGYTREGLSESAGISVKFLYEIETDKKGFSAYTLVRLAQALEVSTDYIMTGREAGRYVRRVVVEQEALRPNALEEGERLLQIVYEKLTRL